MWHGVSVVAKPTAELVTLAKLKARLVVDHDDDNDLLGDLLKAAIARVDGPFGIGYALMEQTWRKTMDCFPRCILLPGAPIKSVTSITYVDDAGMTQTLDPASYRAVTTVEPASIEPAYGTSWPSTRDVTGAVTVEYKIGETDPTNVPPDLVTAVCMIVAHWYGVRGAVAAGDLKEVPMGAQWILDEHARGRVAA
ncbi:hypothetical protein MesoLjLc_45630 [Mesorhizobium sp. L-8-10]|uniref:head-tail connector protein n=1 Tax=Mesorhizobium sp. L-8-10 TaxID=2744523 RepID=UPI00192651C1|nr:head-tail connector protein [Mesorhizobium sp. L-8-10]BCH32633.1 hypothetical protein MesoLjLc_45630 [Mesorhizobium sp. L-8-10]